MADKPTQSIDQEPSRITVSDAAALQDWAKKFDTTPEQIQEAVAAVGDRAADVEMHLKGSHATTNADQERRAEKLDPQ